MRRSPNARRLVYIAGKGAKPEPQPVVTLLLEDGEDVPIAPGHSPRWLDDRTLICCPHVDGGNVLIASEITDWLPLPTSVLGGNSLTGAAGRFATHRVDPRRRVICSWRPTIYGAVEPVLSADGEWVAFSLPDQPPGQSTLIVERADGEGEPRVMATGDIRNARFGSLGSRTLVWEVGAGGLGGCADVGNPHVAPVTFPAVRGWRWYKPAAVWSPMAFGGGLLCILVTADDNVNAHIRLVEWGALERGEVVGYVVGVSTGDGYEHEATADVTIDGAPLPAVIVDWFSPAGVPEQARIDVSMPPAPLARPILIVPPEPTPTPTPEPSPDDVAWTPDPTRAVDMLDYVKAAASAYVDNRNGTGRLWLHKSQERPDWGENWDHDAAFIGFEEDRSTGTRMITLPEPREQVDPWTNTRRDRWSPEQITAYNAQAAREGRPGVGDPATLPLAGYTWRGNRVWMPRLVKGRSSVRFTTQYDWWDLPEFGGRWELHPPQTITAVVETGYARFNGHDVFARSGYLKPNGDAEWNYWGPHGWIAFRAYDTQGHEEVAARATAPPEQRASTLTAPYVPPRRTPTYPIYDPAREAPPAPEEPMADTKPDLRAIPRNIIVEGTNELDAYVRANPALGLPHGLLVDGPKLGDRIDPLAAYVISEYLGAFQAEGALPGVDPNNPGPGVAAYEARKRRALDHAVAVIERERRPRPQ